MARSHTHSLVLRADAPSRRRPLIGLTPLIDVVFILLIFLMLASSFLEWRTIPLAAPAREGGGTDSGAVLVRLSKAGRIDVAGVPTTLDGLASALAGSLRRDADSRVVVQSGVGVPLQRLVTVLDRLTAAGVDNVSLARSGGEETR